MLHFVRFYLPQKPLRGKNWHIDMSIFSILSAPNSFCGVKSAYRYVSFFDPICFRFHLLKISTDNFFTFSVSICSIKYHFYCLNFLSGKRRRLQLKASPMLCEWRGLNSSNNSEIRWNNGEVKSWIPLWKALRKSGK